MKSAGLVIHTLVEARNLAANKPVCGGMILRTANARDAPVLDTYLERACVRTIHRARRGYDLRRHSFIPGTVGYGLPV
jgi:hypothetical protein